MIRIKNSFFFLLTFVIVQFFYLKPVLAATPFVEVSLPVSQNFTVQGSEKEISLEGLYQLKDVSKDAPMPHGSDNVYSFQLSGMKAETVISMNYSKAGVYQYELTQITDGSPFFQYDKKIYKINVYIENGVDGQLTAQVIVNNGDGMKCEKIEFQNFYKGGNTDRAKADKWNSGVKTGDSSNIFVYIVILLGALFLIIAISILKYCKKNRMDD